MGGITSSVGLFSGIDTGSLIQQLLAVEARPKVLVQRRVVQLQQQQAAFLDVNSALLGLKTAAAAFNANNIFSSAKATTSDGDVLTATAGSNAQTGSYNFTVSRLVSTYQGLSRGFTDRDTSALGATSFTFEIGGGAVSTDTKLSELNGGNGIDRGKLVITDSTGASADIDLSAAVTLQDVLDAINSNSTVSVSASVDGDGLRIVDEGGGGGTLKISDAFGSSTASSLGIAKTAAGGEIVGDAIRTISGSTALSVLNDGNGINIRDGGADIKVTTRSGQIFNVDLGEITHTETDPETGDDITVVDQTRAVTVQDVLDIFNQAAADTGVDVTLAINAQGTGLDVTDNTVGAGNLKIENGANGRTTAKDLGIGADVASGTISGRRLISGLNSVLVSNLNGGVGLTATELTITDRSGASTTLNVDAGSLTGSLEELINDINGKLNVAGIGVVAQVNSAGNGIALQDTSGGSNDLIVGGALADELGVASAGDDDGLIEVNLQLKYVSRATRLEDLNAGQGLGTGEIRITDASGATTSVTIGNSLKTVDDLIQHLNSQPIGINVAINAQGDGLIVTDTSGGSGSLVIADETGNVARSLNLEGEATDSGGTIAIDGSYERTVEFDATDTLEEVASKISAAGVGVTATILNDGTGASPYRLSLSSKSSGSVGNVIVDTGGFDLGLETLAKGRDAVVFFGSANPADAVLLTSSTNTLDNVVQGVTIDLNGTSDEPIEVVVSRDVAAIESAIEDFVDAFNNVLSRIAVHDKFDQETETRGALLGDSTIGNIRASMFRTIQGEAIGVEGEFQFLFEVGVKIGSGARLEFDRDRFRAALEEDPENVEQLFAARSLDPKEPIELAPGVTTPATTDTFSALGLAEQVENLVEGLTNSIDGLLTVRTQTIDRQIEQQNRRIASLDEQLELKRQVLSQEFLAMEQAIAALQNQSNALSALQFGG